MKNLLLYILISISCLANDSLEVSGKRYELMLKEIPCVNGASDLFLSSAQIIHDEMFLAGCNIKSKYDSTIDCLKIDKKYLIRNFINSQLRNKNYCSCTRGPLECADYCSKILPKEECTGLCSGNCDLPYPSK